MIQQKLIRQKLIQQRIQRIQQIIQQRKLIFKKWLSTQPLPPPEGTHDRYFDSTHKREFIPSDNICFYNELNSNINCNKTIVSVLDYSYGWGDYLRGCILLAQYAKMFNINFECDLSIHNINKCLENPYNEINKTNTYIHPVNHDNNTELHGYNLRLYIEKFISSNNTKLYIRTNMFYNKMYVTQDIKKYINSIIKFKQFYYDDVKKIINNNNLTNYYVLHIRCRDECFNTEYNDPTLITKIQQLQLHNNTIVISNNIKLKQYLNKLFGFYFIDIPAIHTADTANSFDNFYGTIIEYIILSNSSRTYCFSYYGHGSGFSEQCSVLNNIPYSIEILS
jgi:hypothetical protein